jgi:ArsR family transcriptional regulator
MHIRLPQAAAVPEISREEILRRLHDSILVIVDVLPAVAYAESHIAGALNLPVADIPRRARAVLPNPEREIAVYCGGFT